MDLQVSQLDLQNSVNDIWFRLGFLSLAEMEETEPAPWVTVTELFDWMDEGAKRLAYEVGLFVVFDASVAIVPNNGVCALPATHVFTLLAATLAFTGGSDGTGLTGTFAWGTAPWGAGAGAAAAVLTYGLLRLTSVRDLYSLDGNWPTTVGTPGRASLDASAVGSITLYPIPLVAGTLFQICQEYPPTVASGTSTIAVPTVLQDYFSLAALAGARDKESEERDGPMADHYKQRMDLYEQVMQHLWGGGS